MFEKKEKKPPRFAVKEGPTAGLSVICDTKTGVHYLAAMGDGLTYYSSITPLLDEHGQVVIDKNI